MEYEKEVKRIIDMAKSEKTKILAVGGPTASGKSALALELARRLDGEIVSCDSMQIYRGMNIGTAKPTAEEMGGIPHHMIDISEPDVDYSAADYAEGAGKAIENITSRGKIAIICGGTGMYLDALLRPTSFSEADSGTDSSDDIRRELAEFAASHGNEALHERLREVDPESADNIHPNNVKRVIRALEIYLVTGVTKTESDKKTLAGESPYDCAVITLDYEDRNILYGRINSRVDAMVEDGLLAETDELYRSGKLKDGTTAYQAIGYKELLLHLRDGIPLELAIETLKKNTRNYAKRQITWFKRYNGISIVPDKGGNMRTVSELADEVIAKLIDLNQL